MTAETLRARFRELHAREQLFVMPNPWDVGSARILASLGFEALATTSAGFAWALGKLDTQVTRAELVAHVAELAPATDLPLNIDSERCYPDDPGGVAETVRLLGEAGAAGFSIEDWNPATGQVDDVGQAVERVREAVEAARAFDPPLVVTGRAETHLHGIDDLDDTIARLVAYRDAGADCVYAPWISTVEQISAVVDAVGVPVNVLATPAVPPIPELAELGVRRISTGSLLAGVAYGAAAAAARDLHGGSTSTYAANRISEADKQAAFGSGSTP
jgi:2-methylisocitrate lyase-like PEP mutase family enzyme